jgi:hypothetical protein
MDCHNHAGCPHDHEGDVCLYGGVDDGDASTSSSPDAEATQIAADAAVEIARIEAEVETERIATDLEHHELAAETELAALEDNNDTSIEHHQIEADASDELEEVVEDLIDEVVKLEEIVEEVADPEVIEPAASEESEDEEGEDAGDGDVVEVAPPPRVEAPTSGAKISPRRRGGNLRRGRR